MVERVAYRVRVALPACARSNTILLKRRAVSHGKSNAFSTHRLAYSKVAAVIVDVVVPLNE